MSTADIQDVAGKTFDYIITAGLTLAARLTEDPAKSVLVLEAGEAHLDNKDILAVQAYGSHFGNPAYAYRHKWITQKHAADREGTWERGKGLGGSSGINFLAWYRPPAKDIDDWQTLGNPNWTFSNYLTRVTRVEGLTDPRPEVAARNYIDTKGWTVGRDGPLQVSYPRNVSEGESRVMDTFHKAGFKKNLTPVSPHLTHLPSRTQRRTRVRMLQPYVPPPSPLPPSLLSFFTTHPNSHKLQAFYQPNASRPNLTVLVTAVTRRVLLSDVDANEEVTAKGVEFDYGGKVYEAYAGKEVVLTAGTLSTPHILEVSGIGRRDVLTRIGVPVKVELPGVGENIQEHIFVAFSFKIKDSAPMQTLDILRDPAILAEHLRLEKEGKGLFHEGCIGCGHSTLADLTSPSKAAELHARIVKLREGVEEEVRKLEKEVERKGDVEVKKGLVEQYKLLEKRYSPVSGEGSPSFQWIHFASFFSAPNMPKPGEQYISLMMVMNHPLSRGTIVHVDLIYEQFLLTRKIASLSPLADMIESELNPGPEVQSEAEAKDWIRKTFSTIFHTAGACSMLPKDKGGVVSPELKVYGTKNLRIADLSVVPLHVGANTQSTAYGLGEIAADIINGKWPSA
ncbi:GMC oxidoreductase [Irpex rosettiformis]|uniref:GMC oxidoreductase n=1 Tax=Irpex rosettiformis TaxID=378272 RepID=A0ACB8U078_9APHY|nr:GMC oxidoreductase [Irpex rosettiformis]